jgi:hypothetical protein
MTPKGVEHIERNRVARDFEGKPDDDAARR